MNCIWRGPHSFGRHRCGVRRYLTDVCAGSGCRLGRSRGTSRACWRRLRGAPVGRCRRSNWRDQSSGRRDLDSGTRWRGGRDFPDLCKGQGLTAVALESFLSPLKGWWRGRGSSARYDSPRLHGGRWFHGGNAAGAEYRLFCRHSGRRERCHRGRSYRALIKTHRVSPHRLRGGERLCGSRDDCTGDVAIHVGDVVDNGLIDDRGVVNIVDDRAVHVRIRNVDIVYVVRTHMIGRHVDFPRTQRKPSDTGSNANPRN